MGGGGGAVYLYQMPKTWKDLLIKEGFIFLEKEDEYKGMFNDQKDNESWTQEEELKDVQESNVKNKAQTYCQSKLKDSLPSSSDPNYSSTKQKLISFCTTEGIKTVKGRLIQSKKKNWIDQEKGDEKWKAVFAVYRYNSEFINWLKKDNPSNGNLSQNSNVKDEYGKLKDACKKLLTKNHEDIKNEKEFNYGSWWCVELGYSTIKEKIQRDDSNWNEKSQDAGDWGEVKTKWENTPEVKKWVNKANGSNEEDELDENKFKKLCENSNVTAQLSDNDSYREKYLVIKAVCGNSSN